MGSTLGQTLVLSLGQGGRQENLINSNSPGVTGGNPHKHVPPDTPDALNMKQLL